MSFKFSYTTPPAEELDSTLSYEDTDHVTDDEQPTLEYSPSDMADGGRSSEGDEDVKKVKEERPKKFAGKKHELGVSIQYFQLWFMIR